MFLVNLTYLAPIAEIDKYLSAHREYLDYFYKQGLFLLSGPRTPRTGAVMIVLTKDKKQLEEILQNDPFTLAELVSYEIIEFSPVKHHVELKDLLEKTEGPLC